MLTIIIIWVAILLSAILARYKLEKHQSEHKKTSWIAYNRKTHTLEKWSLVLETIFGIYSVMAILIVAITAIA